MVLTEDVEVGARLDAFVGCVGVAFVEARVVSERLEQVEHAVLKEGAPVGPPAQSGLHGDAVLEPLVGDLGVRLGETGPIEDGALGDCEVLELLRKEEAARANDLDGVLDLTDDVLGLASILEDVDRVLELRGLLLQASRDEERLT